MTYDVEVVITHHSKATCTLHKLVLTKFNIFSIHHHTGHMVSKIIYPLFHVNQLMLISRLLIHLIFTFFVIIFLPSIFTLTLFALNSIASQILPARHLNLNSRSSVLKLEKFVFISFSLHFCYNPCSRLRWQSVTVPW